MKRLAVAAFLVVLTLTCASSGAAGPSTGAWAVVGPDGAPVAGMSAPFDVVGPQGIQCLATALPAALIDKPRLLLHVQAAHLKGTGPLLVGSCPADAVAALTLPAGPTTRQVDLWIGRPTGAGLYLGALAGDEWRLGEPTVDAWNAPSPEVLGSPCVVPQALPLDWQPGGLLDARAVKVGTEQRLQGSAGSVRIILSPEADALRGRREELKAEAFNAADDSMELSSTLQGPPFAWIPPVHWPIASQKTITIRPQFTSFWAGDVWTKLTFAAGGQECSMPLRLAVKPSYPAFGVFLSASATPEDLAAALTQPVSIVAAPAALWMKAGAVHLGPEGFAYGSAADLAALAAAPSAGWIHIACIWGPSSDWAAGSLALSTNEAVKKAGWMLSAGPFHTTSGPQGLTADSADVAALKLCWMRLACVAATPPRLPAVAVAQARAQGFDDKAPTFWANLDHSFDSLTLRGQLREAGIGLPVAWADLSVGDGSPTAKADLAVWSRAAASLLYCGSTGIFARWTPAAGTPAWLEVMRELSSATPVVSPSESPFASVSSGAQVAYKPFIRGTEGTLVVSNNSRRILTLQTEVRAEPLLANILRFAPGVAPVRTCEVPFHFSDDAYALGRPLVFVRLLPGETALLSIRLVDPSASWLRLVEEKLVIQGHGAPQAATGRNDTWWTDKLRKTSPEERRD